MIQNKLLYTVDINVFPKVLKRLDDLKNTCMIGIADENIYHLTREQLKMVPLVDDLEKKELTKTKYTKHILVYHHPYYLIIPIFEYFVYKNGKVNEHLNSLEIRLDPKKKNRKGDAPFFNVRFKTNRSSIQTFNTVVIKLKTITNNETNTD